MALCPICGRTIGTYTGDPIFATPTLSTPQYEGFTQLLAQHIKELQDERHQQEIDSGVTPLTIFTNINTINLFQNWIIYITELRSSTQKILTTVGISLSDFLSKDEDGNIISAKTNWSDPNIEANKYQCKAIHIEDLRHYIQSMWQETWENAELGYYTNYDKILSVNIPYNTIEKLKGDTIQGDKSKWWYGSPMGGVFSCSAPLWSTPGEPNWNAKNQIEIISGKKLKIYQSIIYYSGIAGYASCSGQFRISYGYTQFFPYIIKIDINKILTSNTHFSFDISNFSFINHPLPFPYSRNTTTIGIRLKSGTTYYGCVYQVDALLPNGDYIPNNIEMLSGFYSRGIKISHEEFLNFNRNLYDDVIAFNGSILENTKIIDVDIYLYQKNGWDDRPFIQGTTMMEYYIDNLKIV